jgi:hypothetical protein
MTDLLHTKTKFFHRSILCMFFFMSIGAFAQDLEKEFQVYAKYDLDEIENMITISSSQKTSLLTMFINKYRLYQKAPTTIEEVNSRRSDIMTKIKAILSTEQMNVLESKPNQLYDLFSTRKFLNKTK